MDLHSCLLHNMMKSNGPFARLALARSVGKLLLTPVMDKGKHAMALDSANRSPRSSASPSSAT